MSEYLTFVREWVDMNEGERVLFIKDLTPGPAKYDTKLVRAEIADSPKKLSGADTLWIRSETGVLMQEPWGIKIKEELPPHVAGRPWEDVFAVLKQMK